MSYRYIGNKTRIVHTLLEEIRTVAPKGGTVSDLMCGTAAVCEALKCAGYRVIASDLMTFAYCHAWVRLKLAAPPKFASLDLKSYWDVLRFLNELKGVRGYFFREYAPGGKPANGGNPRQYLSDSNAAKLDAISQQIRRWKGERKLSDDELNLLRHDLVLAVNRVANIAGTYGHYRSSWSNGSLRPLALTDSTFLSGLRIDHDVFQGAAEEVASWVKCDLCYIDPPYMKRQYAANYHLIETVARLDEPEAIGVSGLRPWRDQYSDFCSKIKIWNAFARIFGGIQCPQILISYSEDGLISKDEFIAFFERYGRVTFKSFGHSRFRSNSSPLGRTVQEYLFNISRS
jgi:adenine-specific DNA-methyltransferase